MDKEEELCGLVINVLFTVMWRGASQPKERGSVIASINMLGMNSNAKVQSMTEAIFLTLGQSQSSHFQKLGLRPKA